MATEKPIKIVVIEDQAVFRAGLLGSLERFEEVNIIGEAGNGEAGLIEIKSKKPDLVLLDFHMPMGPGPDKFEMITLAKKAAPDTKLIIITGETNPYVLSLMLYVGGDSLILKNDLNEGSYVIDIIRNTYEGKFRLTKRDELNYQINEASIQQREFIATMNDTELDTIFMFSEGASYEEIAKRLKKSAAYIPHILRHARDKCDLDNNEKLKALYQRLFPFHHSAREFRSKNGHSKKNSKISNF